LILFLENFCVHPILEQPDEEGNIDLQVMFHPGGADEVKMKTISHLMGIASKRNPDDTRQALDDWYYPEVKDYASACDAGTICFNNRPLCHTWSCQ